MENNQSVFNIAIAFDKNYLNPFYALLASLFDNNKDNKLEFHFIATGLSENEYKQIEDYTKKNKAEYNFYTIDEAFVNRFVVNSTWTTAVYYRLFFPLVISKNLKRILYIDTDILVINDLKELFLQDLGNYPVGAVYDNYVKKKSELGIIEEGNYFNSGVLLIDVESWNEQNISDKAIKFLEEYPEKIKFVDQDALNAVLKNNWKKLDWKFNFICTRLPYSLSKREEQLFITDKVILHFIIQRPWLMLCRNRYRSLYFYYLKKSQVVIRKHYVDFNWTKIPAYLKIRLLEWYRSEERR